VRHDVESLPLTAAVPEEDLLAIDEVVDRLCETDAQAGQLVKLRFFAGLSVAEAADAMGISLRTAHNVWTYGRAWLRRELRR
jgi:DNA-directed RNA polymerase specialized sigma24 family protein